MMRFLSILADVATLYAPFVLPLLGTFAICKLFPNLPRKVVRWMEK